MSILTDSEKDRLRDIVRYSRLKAGTFDYAFWFGGEAPREETKRFYFVGGHRTPFRAFYSTDQFGRSFKQRSMEIYQGHHKLRDAEIVSEVIKAIEYHLSRPR